MASKPVIQHLPLKDDKRFQIFGNPTPVVVESECGFVEVSETKGVSNMTQGRQKRGNPYKRGDTWTIDYSFEDPTTGKKIRKRKGGFATKKEAEKALAIKKAKILQGDLSDEVFEVEIAGGVTISKDILFEDYARRWLEIHKEKIVFSTYFNYMKRLEIIDKMIGNRKLTSITRGDIQNVLANVSDGQVYGVKMVLNMVFKSAVIDELIVKNPCQYVEMRKCPNKRKGVLSPEQVAKVLEECLEEDWLSPQVIFGTFLGLRQGESNGLKYSDFDFDKHEVNIVRQIGMIGPGKYGETNLKTAKSKRTIYLPPYVEEYVKNRFAKLSYGGITKDHYVAAVSKRKNINWMQYNSKVRHRLRLIGQELGVEGFSPHTLRHTCATLLIKSGVPAKKVSDLLGHANIHITLDIYCDVLQAQKDVAMSMESIITENGLDTI